jgi:hypothetical protein
MTSRVRGRGREVTTPLVWTVLVALGASIGPGCSRDGNSADADGDLASDGDADSDADLDDAAIDSDVDDAGDSEPDSVPADGDTDGDSHTDGGDNDFDIDADADPDADPEIDEDVDHGGPVTSPVHGAVNAGCDTVNDIGDIYAFEAPAVGDRILVRADTVSAITASNLASFLFYDLDDIWMTYIVEGDDDFACTYPPPRSSCPELEWVVQPRHTGTFYVYVGPVEFCVDPTDAEYVLSVTVNDVHALLTLVADDFRLP